MKRTTYILLALTALIAVACSKTDTDIQTGPEPQKSYIFFEADVLDVAQAKASLITGESLPTDAGTSFGVMGFYEDGEPIFNSYSNNIANVYRKESGGEFQYDNLASWMGTQHTFYAFYPYTSLNSSLLVLDNIPYINYNQPTAEAGMVDILGACSSVSHSSTPAAPVELEFQHLLWAFNITVKNSQTKEVVNSDEIDNPSITIKEITFELSGFPQSALLKLDDTFNVSPTTTTIEPSYTIYSEGTDQITSGQSKTYGPLLFIPVSGLNYRLTVKYVTQGGAEGTMVYPAEEEYKTLSSEFERGKLYVLTIDKENDKFFVGLSAGTWDEITVNHTFE